MNKTRTTKFKSMECYEYDKHIHHLFVMLGGKHNKFFILLGGGEKQLP